MVSQLGAELAADLRDRHLKEDKQRSGKFVRPQLISTSLHVVYMYRDVASYCLIRHPDFPDREVLF